MKPKTKRLFNTVGAVLIVTIGAVDWLVYKQETSPRSFYYTKVIQIEPSLDPVFVTPSVIPSFEPELPMTPVRHKHHPHHNWTQLSIRGGSDGLPDDGHGYMDYLDGKDHRL